MKRPAIIAIFIIFCIAVLAGVWWLRSTDPVLRTSHSSSMSSFLVPDYLDAAGFAERLAVVDFVAVENASFESLLPKVHGEIVPPGGSPPNFRAMPAYRHRANSEFHTRLVGYDGVTRRAYYFHAQTMRREGQGGPWVGDEPDTIEQELRR